MFAKILLASDGSKCALKAAKFAAELAIQNSSKLIVLHVFTIPVSLAAFSAYGGGEVDQVEFERYTSDVQDAVSRRTAEALEPYSLDYETRQEVGHPAETIIRVANEENCDLIVLGSRGLSEIRSFLMGSVCDRVSHHAHCPVLIVK
jgi:nucleotide-binding universal stress UspA family protein